MRAWAQRASRAPRERARSCARRSAGRASPVLFHRAAVGSWAAELERVAAIELLEGGVEITGFDRLGFLLLLLRGRLLGLLLLLVALLLLLLLVLLLIALFLLL